MARGRSGSAMKAAMKELTKSEKSAAKDARKAQKKATKAAVKSVRGGSSTVENFTPPADHSQSGTARARRLIGLGTTLAPLLAPYALAAATAVRGRFDDRRAARLGVSTDQLTAFSGPGGSLHARLSHLAEALGELESDPGAHPGAAEFVERTRPRLTDLSVAVRAAEQMPTSRRRTAFRAISGELDTIELTLLDHLGVPTTT